VHRCGRAYIGIAVGARAPLPVKHDDRCEYAAGAGHLEVLKWARPNHCLWDKAMCDCADGSGQLEVLQWLREHRCPWDEMTYKRR
jgi:hypothetical protein